MDSRKLNHRASEAGGFFVGAASAAGADAA